jgi:hypothetical protein
LSFRRLEESGYLEKVGNSFFVTTLGMEDKELNEHYILLGIEGANLWDPNTGGLRYALKYILHLLLKKNI